MRSCRGSIPRVASQVARFGPFALRVEFVTCPRQGHPIVEPRLIRDAMRRNLEWFSHWILGEANG